MNKFLSILQDEFKHFVGDKGVRLVMVAAIVAYSFCYAIPYYQEVVKDIPIGVVDLDQSDFSKKFVRDIDSTDILDVIGNYTSMKDSEKEFFRGNIKGFIIIPKDFKKDTLQGKQVDVALYADSAYLIIYKTLYASVLQAAIETGAKIEVARMMMKGIPKKQAIVMKQPFEFVQEPLFNPMGGYKSYVYPVILIMILHQTLIMGLGMRQGTRNEKKKKYAQNIEDIPITIFTRSTMYVLLYLFYGAIAFFIFPALFVYPMYYNVLPLFLIYVLMLYAAAFFAQTISYWFKIREAALLTMVASSLIFIFIPGLIWPRESIPELINILSFFIPATCGVDGIIKLNQNGAAFINIMYDYFWLIFLTAFYFITSVILTKKSDSKL